MVRSAMDWSGQQPPGRQGEDDSAGPVAWAASVKPCPTMRIAAARFRRSSSFAEGSGGQVGRRYISLRCGACGDLRVMRDYW